MRQGGFCRLYIAGNTAATARWVENGAPWRENRERLDQLASAT
jgi:hypothetical protein